MLPIRILIADDNLVDRKILGRILQKQGHEVLDAENGADAVALFKQESPDIVLLDVMMPVMDGKEAARQIKQLAGEDMVPVIFLTSMTDAYGLADCLESGGDDFLNKPYNPVVLQAKVRSFYRMREMHQTLQQQRDTIVCHNEHLIQEQEAAKAVFDNVAHLGCLSAPNIRYLISPLAVFNGDVLLAARQPNGSMNLLLGDFTGHGLPAAIGALPLAEIFYGMTAKGFGIRDIIREVNRKMNSILPVGFFCCAVMVEMNFERKSTSIWMGGIPDCYLYRVADASLHTLRSQHLPLGVFGDSRFVDSLQEYTMEPGDRLLLWSDGILEARNPAGDMFGQQRLEDAINSAAAAEMIFPTIKSTLAEFQNNSERDDDITLLEIQMVLPDDVEVDPKAVATTSDVGPMDWSFSYELGPVSLRNFNPLPLVMHLMMEVPGLRMMSGQLYTVMGELFANALEHGVLKLDSTMKRSPEGFMKYYQQRQEHLEQLEDEWIRIDMEHQGDGVTGQLRVRFVDSGDGFDYQSLQREEDSDLLEVTKHQYSGRGISLVSQICKSITYYGKGNEVEAIIHWPHQEEE
ncbi:MULTISPECIES: SpoIIE family protein phosphatase [unclassified Oceanobacter]|uniref:ATP-binding SpoIIE family protein phosphatase n=1 Tax=unclassified Oceanobacter TaxID=2620260 RepID=UPI0026E42F3C|nr:MULTISPECIES: SpoIIE family protein phosphatase [unclassified Oceanobacter]MDO6682278.1 SpoIIE family protein phosphatase [Oceanobacter sp. 5_MG-2023]MDP2506289.1 SpoIIE family protein phosphatase [Oceanobacter sp. 3_MG-2023]MDP2546450.1 SpoIIE family protein phosphatase [Oceanobacter sp. 4_MG-2023]